MEHRGIEPRSSVCKTDVFPLDEHPISIFLQHAPKDSNPDLLGWNQQCYRYTKGVQFFVFRLFKTNFICNTKLQWERKELHLSPTTTQLMAGGLQPPVWKRSPMVKSNRQVSLSKRSSVQRKPWDSNPQRFYPQLFSKQCPHPAG